MLKILGSIGSKIWPGEGGVEVGGGSRAGRNGNKSRIDDGKVDDSKVRDDKVEKKVQKLFKSKNLSRSKKMIGSDFLTPRAKLAFTKLRQAFVKALILYHFDPKCHIRIETYILNYAIGGVLSQLTLNDLGRWYLVAFSF